ncbi:MAG: dipeptidase PepE [Prevotellaceae bacterium]|jgi:dipeptidase E|nr:dipeptidase PepE [Prevotellaceae bacterium]
MKLLLISNSTNVGEGYLEYCRQNIAGFLQAANVTKVLFFPFAAVTFSYDEYRQRVQNKLAAFGIEVDSIHRCADARKAAEEAQAIVVGGGNTFHLLKNIQALGVLETVRRRVKGGIPYVGWSAGANLACPTICTTNDMPIVTPLDFSAFNLIPFQINPHYTDFFDPKHGGETREQRIDEYLAANPEMFVAGLREASMLYVEGRRIRLHGERPLRLFKFGQPAKEYRAGDDLSFLMEKM